MTREGRLIIVRKEHIRAFAEPEDCIPLAAAQDLLELVSQAAVWDDCKIQGCKEVVLESRYDLDTLSGGNSEKIREALELITNSKPFPAANLPGAGEKNVILTFFRTFFMCSHVHFFTFVFVEFYTLFF